MEAAEQLKLISTPGKGNGSVSLKYKDPETGRNFTFGTLFGKGDAWFYMMPEQCEKAGIDPEIGRQYLREVAALLPGGKVVKDNVQADVPTPKIAYLMPKRDKWYQAIAHTVQAIQEAMVGSSD
jgi:hypothetical protein